MEDEGQRLRLEHAQAIASELHIDHWPTWLTDKQEEAINRVRRADRAAKKRKELLRAKLRQQIRDRQSAANKPSAAMLLFGAFVVAALAEAAKSSRAVETAGPTHDTREYQVWETGEALERTTVIATSELEAAIRAVDAPPPGHGVFVWVQLAATVPVLVEVKATREGRVAASYATIGRVLH